MSNVVVLLCRKTWGIGRDLTFINANCPCLGVNMRSNVYTTWSDKRSNACPTMVKCVVSNDFMRQIPTQSRLRPGGGVVHVTMIGALTSEKE